jgi:hypothetical protein
LKAKLREEMAEMCRMQKDGGGLFEGGEVRGISGPLSPPTHFNPTVFKVLNPEK